MEKINEMLNNTEEYPLQKPDPEKVPTPTIWPVGLAFAVLFILWGLIASMGLSFVGILVFGVSLAGWISDLKPRDYEKDED